jgi:hypothetical protein
MIGYTTSWWVRELESLPNQVRGVWLKSKRKYEYASNHAGRESGNFLFPASNRGG